MFLSSENIELFEIIHTSNFRQLASYLLDTHQSVLPLYLLTNTLLDSKRQK